jgi:hypothetical protein
MAAIFLPLGLGIWVPALLRLRRGRRASPEPRELVAAVGREAWLRQLNQLRSSGALPRAEFDQLKRDDEPSADTLALIGQLAGLKASGVLTREEFEAKKQAVMQRA